MTRRKEVSVAGVVGWIMVLGDRRDFAGLIESLWWAVLLDCRGLLGGGFNT